MPPLIDLTGQKFNYLTVLKRAEKNINNRPAWECQCDCGNICIVKGSELKNGHTKSCGCYKIKATKEKFLNDALSHIGEKYGHLTIIDVTQERTKDRHIIYKCQCDCEEKNIVYYPLKDLSSGHTTSCGCLISKGENKIKNILKENNIPFEQQKVFNSCRFLDTNSLAKFDFYINNSYIVEFDGKQHFISYNSGWSTEEALKKTQEHDKFKNDWCQKNNIPLIRIPYTHLEEICLKDLLLNTTKYLVKDKNKGEKGNEYFYE